MAVTKKRNTKKEVVFDSSVLSTPNSYLALAYGALTVLILFFAIFLVIKLISHRNLLVNQPIQTISDQGISTHREEAPNSYTVVEGNSLWSIAQNKYNDGYKWTEIVKANNITEPGIIEIGQKLTLPSIRAVSPEVTSATDTSPPVQNANEKITGVYYTVVEGDSLWTIALRAYGDGYKWVDIMNRNNIETPDIIYPGDKYVLPR